MHTGGELGFETVGRERRGAAIDGKIGGAARIDDHGNAALASAVDQRAQYLGRQRPLVDIGNQNAIDALQLRFEAFD